MGTFSGLTPKILSISVTDTADIAGLGVCKFNSEHTVTDAFYHCLNALTGNTTDFVRFTMLNGKTTGNQTTNLAVAGLKAGGASVSWTALTAKTVTTNYTYSANHWLVTRYSEDGTVAMGAWCAVYWAVEGNV